MLGKTEHLAVIRYGGDELYVEIVKWMKSIFIRSQIFIQCKTSI